MEKLILGLGDQVELSSTNYADTQDVQLRIVGLFLPLNWVEKINTKSISSLFKLVY